MIPALLGKESSRVAIQPLLGFDFAVDMAVWGRTAVPIAGMVEPRAEIQPKHPVEKKADAIRSNTFSPVPVAKPYIAPKVQYSAPTAARVSVSAAERVLDSNIRMRTTERPADGAEKIPTAVGNTTHSLPRDSRSSRLEEVFSSWTLPFPFPFPFPNISTVVEQPVVRATHFSPFVSAMVQPQFIAHEPHMVIRMALPALTLGHSLRAATFGERRDPSDRVEPVSESADSHSQNGHSGHDTDDQPQDSDQQSS
ncbi:MAG: hypothetical protein HY540_05860 [Deltaproteobacteria bacterium]|nr:hypothetical protein [Deltaproteobacteria bacterium]